MTPTEKDLVSTLIMYFNYHTKRTLYVTEKWFNILLDNDIKGDYSLTPRLEEEYYKKRLELP